jgi:hypothetical protein
MSGLSSLPQEQANVTLMRDFLRETLEAADEFHVRYHRGRDTLRARLHALELAEDPVFQEEVGVLAEELGSGQGTLGLTVEEFHHRFSLVD